MGIREARRIIRSLHRNESLFALESLKRVQREQDESVCREGFK